MIESDDLAKLRQEFPAWNFGTVWLTANSGPTGGGYGRPGTGSR